MNAEFAKHGLSVSITRLTLDPLHGLVARDVVIYDVKSGRNWLGTINQITFDINYSNLLRRQMFLNGIDLRNAKLTLPIGPSGPAERPHPNLQIECQGPFPAGPALSQQSRCGRLRHPRDRNRPPEYPEQFHMVQQKPASPGSNGGGGSDPLREALSRIISLKFDACAPELNISFSGDAREPEKVFAEATLHGERISVRNQNRIASRTSIASRILKTGR